MDGPCNPTTGVCKTKPADKFADTRYGMLCDGWVWYCIVWYVMEV